MKYLVDEKMRHFITEEQVEAIAELRNKDKKELRKEVAEIVNGEYRRMSGAYRATHKVFLKDGTEVSIYTKKDKVSELHFKDENESSWNSFAIYKF